jgi:hypothetical protein
VTALVFWIGPVTAQNLAAVHWAEPTRVLVVNRYKGLHSSTAFGELGALCAKEADPLAALALFAEGATGAENGPRPEEIVMLAHFSAGFGTVEHLLRRADVRARVSAVLAFDSYYIGGVPGAVKPGFEAYLRDVANGGVDLRRGPGGRAAKVNFFTTSHTGGPDYPSASKALGPLWDRFETYKGAPGELGPVWAKITAASPIPGAAALPVPEAGRALMHGSEIRPAMWVDFGGRLRHGEHATKVAPVVLASVSTAFAKGGGGLGVPPGAPPGMGGAPGDGGGGGLGLAVLLFLAKQLLSGDD